MKKLNIFLFALLSSLTLTSCFEEEFDSPVMNTDPTFELSTSSADVVLLKDNMGSTAFTLSWNAPDYGVTNEAPMYDVLMNGVSYGVVKGETEMVFETGELNAWLLNNGFQPDEAQAADIHVTATVGTLQSTTSTQSVQFTAFADKLDLSTTWGLVGSATPNGWGDGPDTPFYKTSVENVLVTYVTLTDGEIKIRENNDWAVNYGDNEAAGADQTTKSGTLESGGGNIPMAAGTYMIEWNTSTLEYSIAPYTWGLVGSATPNGWGDGPDTPMTYDATTDTWKAYITLVDGEMKIRKNNDWGTNYGDNGLDGILDEGGDNIPVTAGSYYVIVDFKTLEYTMEAVGPWGLVGSATPNGWGDGPDTNFMKDFSNDSGWYVNNVTLVDGEIKVRRNNDWGVNYGDTGADGILDEGGDNIAISAGTYDFYLDFEGEGGVTLTITQK